MDHTGSHFEIGRVEDTVILYVGCSCGWLSDEVVCDKGGQQAAADSVHRSHVLEREAKTRRIVVTVVQSGEVPNEAYEFQIERPEGFSDAKTAVVLGIVKRNLEKRADAPTTD
jgi:hypothetical protein